MSFDHVVPDSVELATLLDELRKLSWAAADVLMAYARGEKPPYGYPKALTVEEGGDGPVTAADLAVNDLLMSKLKCDLTFNEWDILSEETCKGRKFQVNNYKKDWCWILDPLDGTKDFLQGSENYAVHLALVYKKVPKIGLVLIPERNELWFGIIGVGAWSENRMGTKKPSCFSGRENLSDLILVSSKNHHQLMLQNLLASLSFAKTNKMGSVGCKIASILRGESDIYISLSGKTSPKDWDMAAPHALIEAAGGFFTHADGSSLNYLNQDFSQPGCLVASYGKSQEKIYHKLMAFFDKEEPEYIV